MNNIDDTASYRRFTEHRGQWALQRKGYYQEFGWSVEAEFDESILLWHIATHLLFHDFKMFKEELKNQELNSVSQMVLPGVSEPVLLPVPRSVTAPVSQMVLPGVSEPVLLPVPQSVMAPVLQTVLPGVSEPVLRQVAQSVTAPVSQMVLPGVSEPVLLPVAQSVMAPVSEPVLLPVSQSEHKNEPKFNSEPEISHEISNYMMFLLIVRPFMMPAGIGQIRFGDTCAEAKNFLQQQGHIDDTCEAAVRNILDVNTDYDPALVKGDRSKSVLFKGCMLAHNLKNEFASKENDIPDWNKMWRLISVVWAEMLCYAASKCSGQFHAKQLSKGGELLTVIWFLMAHMGMGEQYRIEEGHARAKLIVSK